MPGGMPPRTPPLLVTSWAHSPFLCFLQEQFLANERDNIFGEALRITRNHIKTQQTNGGLSSTCMHGEPTERQERDMRAGFRPPKE